MEESYTVTFYGKYTVFFILNKILTYIKVAVNSVFLTEKYQLCCMTYTLQNIIQTSHLHFVQTYTVSVLIAIFV